MWTRQNGELPRVETSFSALSIQPMLTRSASTSGDYVSSNLIKVEEYKKIEEVLALLMKRELEGNKIFKCSTCNELGHYSSKCPKRVKKYNHPFKSRMPKDCLIVNDKEFMLE